MAERRQHRAWTGAGPRGVAAALAVLTVSGTLLAPRAMVSAAPLAKCEIPAAVKPTPTVVPVSDAPIATPRLTGAAATPVAGGATPVAPTPTAIPVSPEETEITAVVTAIAECMTTGDGAGVAELATDRYLGELFGGDPISRAEYVKIAEQLNVIPVEIRAVDQVKIVKPGAATAIVESVVGNQLLRERWSFVQAPKAEQLTGQTPWRVDSATQIAIPAPRDADNLNVTLADYSIAIDGPAATKPDVILHGENQGAEDHEMLVLRLDNGMTTADLLRAAGPALPAGVTYIGQATVPTGQKQDLVLLDLKPGVYTVVCLLEGPRGTPHLALGMAATFTVGGH